MSSSSTQGTAGRLVGEAAPGTAQVDHGPLVVAATPDETGRRLFFRSEASPRIRSSARTITPEPRSVESSFVPRGPTVVSGPQ